jgi:hypothetical protein
MDSGGNFSKKFVTVFWFQHQFGSISMYEMPISALPFLPCITLLFRVTPLARQPYSAGAIRATDSDK